MAASSDNKQWSTPGRFVVGPESNASDDLFDWAVRRPDHLAFARKESGTWRSVTARQFVDRVVTLAAGLIEAGIEPGDRVGLIADTSFEWVVCDYAIWAAGAVTVPGYPTAAPAQLAWILNDCGASAAFVMNDELRSVVLDARPSLKGRVWKMNDAALTALASSGASVPADLVERRRRSASADSTATIVYTSGTTGQPKGCVLTHGNLVAEVRSILEAEDIARLVLTPNSSILVFLPLAHILARVALLASVRAGTRVALTGLDTVAQELAAFQPEVILVVPRVLEKVYNRAARHAEATGRGRIFRAAADTAVAYSRARADGTPGWWLRVQHGLFDRLVYRRLRAAFGGHVQYAASGGAPLDPRLGHFMRGIGVNVLDGWGLTETAAPVTLSLPAAQRIGTVGRPLPGNTVKVNPDGEVLVKGPAVFRRYWNNEAATEEALDADGWLRTGDLGEVSRDGYVTISGRKKDLIVTASGKNIAPAFLEDRLAEHWLIDQCVVVGDKRPYITALIALDPEAFEEWKRERHLPPSTTVAELHDDAALRTVVQNAIDEVNREVSRPEQIKRFRIVPGYFTVGDQLTPTQKTRRQRVLTQFDDEVEALYTEER